MASSRKITLTALLISGASVFSISAYAQTVPSNIPPAARPENIQRQYQIEERPAVGGEPVITLPENEGKALKGNVTFELKSVTFEGNTIYSADDLKSLYADKLGKKISLSDLNAIAGSVTAFYRNNGYILSRAVVPPQHISTGNVKIRIIEGFVSNVRIEGQGINDSTIQAYADKIKASKPLNAADLERYLLLMQDLPGVEARAVLKPSDTTPGASDVVIDITRKPVDASVSLDNRGSRFLGPIQASAMVGGNNLFGWDDQTQLRVINTPLYANELKYVEVRHEEQLGSEGTKLVLSGNDVRTNPGYSLDTLGLEGESATLTAGLTHPLIRSRQANWFLNTDFTSQHVSADVGGNNLYNDNVRVWTIGTSYDFVDSLAAVNRMEINASKGFNIDTGNDGLNHSTDGDTSFFKMSGNVSRLQPIMGPWGIYAAAEGQVSANPLLSAEQFALGGQQFGSAYDTAEITGDSGLAGRLELQFSQAQEARFLPSYQLYAFYDIGTVWNRGPGANSSNSRESLADTGVGGRFNLIDQVSGGVELAIPLTRKVAASVDDGDAPRVFFNLQYRY